MIDVISEKFITSDGLQFDDFKEANAHENECIVVNVLMSELHERPIDNDNFNAGRAAIQQDPATVDRIKGLLIELTKPKINPELVADVEAGDRPLAVRGADWYCHKLRSHTGALQGAWGRLTCVDDDYREWSEPHFARAFRIDAEIFPTD